ncbi:MAG TPA: alpha-1,4-glucan--maltose-1-phosphate maltosyltransferase [Rudaea sp.]|nr:alpha-1,4-glucan--maltose-1-phosphate maltosyltransferase [Rudaea sp.]
MARAKPNAGRSAPVETKRTPARQKKSVSDFAPRIFQAVVSENSVARAATLGFDHVLTQLGDRTSAFDMPALRAAAKLASAQSIGLLLDIELHRVGAEWPLVQAEPAWFQRVVAGGWPVDPRRGLHAREFLPRFDHANAVDGLADAFVAQLASAIDYGAAGFAINWPQRIPASVLKRVISGTRCAKPSAQFIAWAPGLSRTDRSALADAGFDASFCSLPWWDYRAPWFIDELADLRRCGEIIAPVSITNDRDRERAKRLLQRAAATAALTANGWMLQGDPDPSLDAIVAQTNAAFSRAPRTASIPVSAPWSRVTAWLDPNGDSRRVTLINSDADHHASVSLGAIQSNVGLAFDADALVLAPAEVKSLALPDPKPVILPHPENAVKKAIAAPRVAIESVTPSIDDGAFAAKRVVGDMVVVEADVFGDGHPVLSVRLLWCSGDFEDSNIVRMRALGNDRWRAEFTLRREGLHFYTVEAGIDEFAGLRSGIDKKVAAGQNVVLDIEEARLFIVEAQKKAPAEFRSRLRTLEHEISAARDPAARLLAPDAAELMSQASEPAFLSRASKTYSVIAERRAASFSSWYELFPRSQGKNGKHGTFDDVIAELPRIQSMGFDVLYFPPIHPIGEKNRKGKNNSLTTQPGEPGSPYAIGAKSGGHDAIHPELGTLDDFLALVDAAKKHGLELALDFAVQCSPDHPWIKQHPEWFAWRPDGTMRYAENPPKKYEDIVNVDFYAKDAKPALWIALRDVVAFWLKNGVRIFRVDNPHTKPLPFWEWLIADMRAIDPGVIFLSEAFTRPKVMYRLAKIGFSQSYTYFTWRNTRPELETYLKELNSTPVRNFFRPHFFVNTPDINPYFLQTSGRAGFLIRAALATTLSGLWGMYSGFELCEAAPLPGKEEYLDSEKYELRPRDWSTPGNINAEVTRLNHIRRENPALQTHLGITFYHCGNSNILYFGKATSSRDNVVLVAVNLDPHNAQESDIEIPLWEFGLDDNAALVAEELVGGDAFEWRGKRQRIRLDPSNPYRIWRVRSEKDI